MYIIFMLILITAEQKMNNDGRRPPNRRQPYNQNVRRADQVPIKKVIPLSNYIKGQNPDSVVQIYADNHQTYENCIDAINKHYDQTKETLMEYKQVQEIPNKLKFISTAPRQMWLRLKIMPTNQLYIKDIMGALDSTEFLYIHALSHPIYIMIAGAQEPIKLLPYNSLKAFDLKGRARQIYIEVPHPRTYIAIEAIQPEVRRPPPFEPTCKIYQALMRKDSYVLSNFEAKDLFFESVFIATTTQRDGDTRTSTLLEAIIIGPKEVLFDSLIAPRTYIKVNEKQMGIKDDEIHTGMDIFKAEDRIKAVLKDKVVIGYNIRQKLQECNVPSYYIKGYIDLSILSYLTHIGIGISNKMTRMPYIARRLQLDIEITPNNNIRANLEMTLIMEIWRAIAKPALKFMQQETNQEKQNWQNEILQGGQLNPEEKQNLQELWEEEAKSLEINQRKLREKLKPIVNARATWTSMASKETERDNQRIAIINQPLRLLPNEQTGIESESNRELTLTPTRPTPPIEPLPSTSVQQGEEPENVITLDVMDKEFTDGSSSYISANEEANIPSLKSKISNLFKKTTKRPEKSLGNSQSSVEERRPKQRKKEKVEKLKLSSFEKVTHTDLDVPVPFAYKSIRIAAQASVTHNDGQIPTHITYKGVKWPIEALVIGDPEGSIARRMIWHLPTFRDERYLRGGEM